MRTMILIFSAALLLTSCAHAKTETAASGDHDEACTCGGHEEKGEHHSCEGHADEAKAASMKHHAGNMTEHVDALFAEKDADGDGALTKEEVGEHHLAAKFDAADADGDGKISRQEMLDFGKKMHAKMEAAHGEDAAAGEAVEAAPEATETDAAEATDDGADAATEGAEGTDGAAEEAAATE